MDVQKYIKENAVAYQNKITIHSEIWSQSVTMKLHFSKKMREAKMEDVSNKKPKLKHPNDQAPSAATTEVDTATFKPSSEVKGLNFGAQFVTKSFTVRRANPLDILSLLSLKPDLSNFPFSTTASYIPTNFTILAHRAWHTLTLGLGTKTSKVLIFVFESVALKLAMIRFWPGVIPLGEVKSGMIRGMRGCEMARFKERKGCITCYIYAVRRAGCGDDVQFGEDLGLVLRKVRDAKDYLDHTAMLARPDQKSIDDFDPMEMDV